MEFTIDSYESFLRVIFRQPPDVNREPWFYQDDADIHFDYATVAEYFIRLFTEASLLRARFSPTEIQQGFDSLTNINFPLDIETLVWESGLPIESRIRVIGAMPALYRNLFAHQFVSYAASMWWDVLAYPFTTGRANRNTNPEHAQLQDAMHDALSEILLIPDESCQGAALHGFNHLQHPSDEQVINAYLANSPNISADLRQYAQLAILGVMP